MSDMMYCAECGEQMTRRDDGAWNIHCNGLGYWYNYGPLQRDKWWTLTKNARMFFYPTVNWPRGRMPTQPRT